MNAKLSQAVEVVEKLPVERQDMLADALMNAARRELMDARITSGDRVALHPADLPEELAAELDKALDEMKDVEAAELNSHGTR